MLNRNKVLSGYSAIVNGKASAIAGCNTTTCQRDCLRKDTQLRCRETWVPEICTAFIPVISLQGG